MPLIQALTSAWVNRIVPSSGYLLLRMEMCPSGKAATSTQVPLFPLKLLVRRLVSESGAVTGVSDREDVMTDEMKATAPRGGPLQVLRDYGGWGDLRVW
jgi:hypothetical protein